MLHSLGSIDVAHIVALVLDATDGLSGQISIPKVQTILLLKYTSNLLIVFSNCDTKSDQEKPDCR